MKPKRVQRKRIKGWKMPPNTISVTRPGEWGNPFRIGERGLETIEEVLKAYEDYVLQGWLPVENLRGKNLACFCPLDKPCHADILLKIANY